MTPVISGTMKNDDEDKEQDLRDTCRGPGNPSKS
jgi:hypothetical protein